MSRNLWSRLRLFLVLAAAISLLTCAFAFADPEDGTEGTSTDTTATTETTTQGTDGEGAGTDGGADATATDTTTDTSGTTDPATTGTTDQQEDGITFVPSGTTLDPTITDAVVVDDTVEASPTGNTSASTSQSIVDAVTAAIRAAMAQQESSGSDNASGDAETTDPEADSEAEPAEPVEPAKPYSTLTPVGGEDNPDNTVNTHQLPDSSFLYDTSLAELAGANSVYDGQTIQIIGEVIGDILHDGDGSNHVWVMLASTDPTSDATVILHMPASSASIIDTLGVYGKTGTILQVRGTYHLVCPDHEGMSDIHVENVNVVSPGTSTPDTFSWAALRPGILLLVLAGILAAVLHMLRQRLR